jgi:hypothetical protein
MLILLSATPDTGKGRFLHAHPEMPVVKLLDHVRVQLQCIVIDRIWDADHLGIQKKKEKIVLIPEFRRDFPLMGKTDDFLVIPNQFLEFF